LHILGENKRTRMSSSMKLTKNCFISTVAYDKQLVIILLKKTKTIKTENKENHINSAALKNLLSY